LIPPARGKPVASGYERDKASAARSTDDDPDDSPTRKDVKKIDAMSVDFL
jgi:hypothetical protein